MVRAMAMLGGLLVGSGAVLGQTHDSIVLIPAPITVKIPAGQSSTTKTVSSLVRNGDRTVGTSHPIALDVSSDCPPGTILAAPDFHASTSAIDSVAEVSAGKARRAVTLLQISAAAFTSANAFAPQRCTLTFTADTPISGNVDPTPRNNVVTLELNVIDLNDAPQAAVHETFIHSMRVHHPKKVRVGPGTPVKTVKYRLSVANGDLGEAVGDEVSVTAGDGDCPAGSVGLVDFDLTLPNTQGSTALIGGASGRGYLPVTIDGALFFSTGHTVPDRCTAVLTVSGPGGDSDPSNNSTRLIINVIDDNDF